MTSPDGQRFQLNREASKSVREIVSNGGGLPDASRALLTGWGITPSFSRKESVPETGSFILIANQTPDNLTAVYAAAAMPSRSDVLGISIRGVPRRLRAIQQYLLPIKDPASEHIDENMKTVAKGTEAVLGGGGVIAVPGRVKTDNRVFGIGVGVMVKRVPPETPLIFAHIDTSNNAQPTVTLFPRESVVGIIPNIGGLPDAPDGHSAAAKGLQDHYEELRKA